MCKGFDEEKPWRRVCCPENSEDEICKQESSCGLPFAENGPLFYMDCPLIEENRCGIKHEEQSFPLKIDDRQHMVLFAEE